MDRTKVEYIWHGDKVTIEMDHAIEVALHSGILLMEANAKTLAPLDTGNLRGSIKSIVKKEEKSAWIYTDVKYAIQQEFGSGIYQEFGQGRKTPWVYKRAKDGKFYRTRGQRPQSFMRASLETNHTRVQNLMGGIIRRITGNRNM